MPRGGYRPGAGRKTDLEKHIERVKDTLEVVPTVSGEFQDAKEFLKAVYNNSGLDIKTRMSAAAIVLPYECGKIADAVPGKKEQRQNNAENSASTGRFGVPSAPKIAVDNTK